jgi:hypothetical protein
MTSLLERHRDKIAGVISCFDRVVIHGTLPGICYADGMTAYLHRHDIRIFDYPRFAQQLRDEVRVNAERLAEENGVQIEFVRKASFRKEERIKQVIAERGTHPGLVHILSAMESCAAYKPWHDKKTHRTFLRPDSGQCLHYDFYFIDPKTSSRSCRPARSHATSSACGRTASSSEPAGRTSTTSRRSVVPSRSQASSSGPSS